MASITPEVYQSMGLNDSEYSLILKLLEREPSLTELGMFSVMWSEHCGYKYSRPVLAYFKKYKEAMEGAGLENAGVVDIGDGLGITMKVESHNHPSAVEPYQGAATGVGGIIRDILTMGARPIALLNSLRFGTIHDGEEKPEIVARNRYLFEHVVHGIAGYGNCVGVPTVAGEVNFHPRYSGNPLVNAMCVGILELDKLTTAAASGIGNPVYYLGSATGKDGIHGATFASDALGEDNEDKRPNVQIGDPFAEKLLIEATLEALDTGTVVAIQDMGAAGLTCSTVEMASKGSVGMTIDLDLVPMRENDMSAYELMLSESQERMFAVVQAGKEAEFEAVFKKWGLHVVRVGTVTGEERANVTRFGKPEADVNPKLLTDYCPTYTPNMEVPDYHKEALAWEPTSLPAMDPQTLLMRLLSHPDVASKRFVWQQFDQSVQTQTAVYPGPSDAAVIAPRGTTKGIAIKLDGNARQVYQHPYVGAICVVAEAARNVACTGARPTAITDGLNFGNPQRPHVYWQFSEAVKGIADASDALGTPVISGNVSFYNESDLGEVLPTPMIGMVGILNNAGDALSMAGQLESGVVMLVAAPVEWVQDGLGASLAAAMLSGKEVGVPTAPNMAGERALGEFMVKGAEGKWMDWAHDCSEGGIATAAAEVCLAGKVGMMLTVGWDGGSSATGALYGEVAGRILVGIAAEHEATFAREVAAHGLSGYTVGVFDRSLDRLEISLCDGIEGDWHDSCIKVLVSDLEAAYEGSIPSALH